MIAHQRLPRGPEKGRRFQESNPNKLQKDPRTKHPGVSVFKIGKMIETDSKKQREAEFTQKYTLTPQDFRKMILEKIARNQVYSNTVRKREIAQEQS